MSATVLHFPVKQRPAQQAALDIELPPAQAALPPCGECGGPASVQVWHPQATAKGLFCGYHALWFDPHLFTDLLHGMEES